MAKQRNAEKCKELAQHRPLSKAFSQNDASFCTDPTFTKFFQSQYDPVMAEASALAAANTDSHLLQKIWQKLSTLDKIENKVDTALKRLDRLEQHAQDFSQDLEPSHHKLKEELLLTKEVIQDIIPNLPDFSEDGLDNDDDDDDEKEEEEEEEEHFGGTETLEEDTLQNFERDGRDDVEPELFFMEEEMGDLCTSLHTPDSSPGRKSVDGMYLVDFPSSCDHLDTSSTPFSETYDIVSPLGAPSEFYPNLSEISGSNDHDDFTIRGASIKDASEIGDEEDYEDFEEDEEDQDSEDDYWRLCPNEQVNQYGMSTIQRTSMGLLEQISRLQEELGVSATEDENEESESTEEEVEEHRTETTKDGYPYAPRLEDVQVLLPDIDAMMQSHMDEEDELEMPQSVADASDVADLEDIAVKLRHASKGDDEENLDYMTIEEFQMMSGGLTSGSSNESQTSLATRQVAVPSIHMSPQSLHQKSSDDDEDDSWGNDDSDEHTREDDAVNGHSYHIHGMTNGSDYDGSTERTLPGPHDGGVDSHFPPSDFRNVQGNVGSDISCGRTVSMMSEESVPFVTPLASFDINLDHEGGCSAGGVIEENPLQVEKQNGEINDEKEIDSDNVMSKGTIDSNNTNELEPNSFEQKPRSISEKINCLNEALAQNWGLKSNFKRKSLMKKIRTSLKKKSTANTDQTDSNENSGDSVVSDSVLTIFEALKTFEERAHQVERKKTQLKRKMSSVETHLGRASSAIKSVDVSSGSSAHSCHLDTSIDTKSEQDRDTKHLVGNITKIQKHFPTGLDKDVTQSQLPPKQQQQPPNQENGMGHLVGSKINGISDHVENGGDVVNQVQPSLEVEVEEYTKEENPYAVVNQYSEDENNDEKTSHIQDRGYAEPCFPEETDRGYAAPQTRGTVTKEEPSNCSATDTDLPTSIVNEEGTMPIISVDAKGNKSGEVNKRGCGDTSSSSAQENTDNNEYEIVTIRQIQPSCAQIQKELSLDECENDRNITKSATKEVPLDSPDLIKTLPDVPLKAKSPVFQKEEKMEQEKNIVEKKNEVEVVRNLLPSEIKKKQVGPTGIKVNRSNVTKPSNHAPPKPTPSPLQNSVNSSNVEVVHRPPGSRRARIIRSFLELERIKKEGVNRADGKPVQITTPSMLMTGSGMKAVSGAGGGLRGSDQMLEDMINLQLMQAMGMNPHTIATPAVDTSSKATPPQRPSHLPIPAPIKTTKPVPKQPLSRPQPSGATSRTQTSGPSHGIAKMLNRFGENSASAPKPAYQGFHGTGKTNPAPLSKGLKKTPGRNAFNIEVKDGDVEINISDDNRQFLMNKLAPHSRGKGKLP